jgi:hypothetical protein
MTILALRINLSGLNKVLGSMAHVCGSQISLVRRQKESGSEKVWGPFCDKISHECTIIERCWNTKIKHKALLFRHIVYLSKWCQPVTIFVVLTRIDLNKSGKRL